MTDAHSAGGPGAEQTPPPLEPGGDFLSFMMGEYEARFPTDRQYATNHMWATEQQAGLYRFGLSAYAVRLLQDVYFLDWTIDAGANVTRRQEIGSIESKKAESSIYCPAAGRVARLNETAVEDPSAINVEPYGDGWLLEIESETVQLLSPDEYMQHLAEAWEVAQKTIKGQANA